jgi:hypothetical protein
MGIAGASPILRTLWIISLQDDGNDRLAAI